METPKKNKVVRNAFFKALFRGGVRSLPFGIGNILVEIADVFSDNKMPDKKLLSDPNLTPEEAADVEKFRRWTQIVFQLTICACVLYGVFTKQIDVVKLLEYFAPSQSVTP